MPQLPSSRRRAARTLKAALRRRRVQPVADREYAELHSLLVRIGGKVAALALEAFPRALVEGLFTWIRTVGEQVVYSLLVSLDIKVKADLRRVPGVDLKKVAPTLKELTTIRNQNVDKIVMGTRTQIERVREILKETPDLTASALKEKIQRETGVDGKRAELWARDQTLKMHGDLTKARHLAAGIEGYIWTTSHDVRVRHMHEMLDSKPFKWSDPPITNAQGDRNHPGGDYQCRCTAYPDI